MGTWITLEKSENNKSNKRARQIKEERPKKVRCRFESEHEKFFCALRNSRSSFRIRYLSTFTRKKEVMSDKKCKKGGLKGEISVSTNKQTKRMSALVRYSYTEHISAHSLHCFSSGVLVRL